MAMRHCTHTHNGPGKMYESALDTIGALQLGMAIKVTGIEGRDQRGFPLDCWVDGGNMNKLQLNKASYQLLEYTNLISVN